MCPNTNFVKYDSNMHIKLSLNKATVVYNSHPQTQRPKV